MARCRLGSGAFSVAFAAVLSPAPMRPFPPPALRTGRAGFPHPALQWDHATRTRDVGSGGSPSRYRWLCVPPAGFVGVATPAGLRSSVILPHLWPLSSAGVTPRLQYYGPLRHPAGPACPSRGPGCRAHGIDRVSRVAALSIFHACRHHYPGGNRPVRSSLASQPAVGLPLMTGGSASALTVSRLARCSLAFRPAWSLSRPRRPFSPGCFNPCRYLHEPPWLLPAGATAAGWDSHPLGKRAFPRRTVM